MGAMAKKKQSKKHKFKYAGEVQGVSAPAAASVAARPAQLVRAAQPASVRAAVAMGARDFSYVGRDLRRIAVLAAGLVLLELALWYLFSHTGVGNSVYNFINV